MTGIERAVEIAGSQEALAAICGVKQPAVSKWVNRGYAPRRYHDPIWEKTSVPRDELLADITEFWRAQDAA